AEDGIRDFHVTGVQTCALPISAPPLPLHLVAQQLLALTLQERGVGRLTWPAWLGEPFVFGRDAAELIPAVVDHLVAAGYLAEDEIGRASCRERARGEAGDGTDG